MKVRNETYNKVARVLRAVSHPARLRIIETLEEGEKCVGDIVTAVGIQQAVISQHLNLMRDKEILSCRRDGSRVLYAISNPNVIQLLHCVYRNCDPTGSSPPSAGQTNPESGDSSPNESA